MPLEITVRRQRYAEGGMMRPWFMEEIKAAVLDHFKDRVDWDGPHEGALAQWAGMRRVTVVHCRPVGQGQRY